MPRHDTEPYEQLVSKEEIEALRPSGNEHQRYQKQREQGINHPAMDDLPERPPRDYAPEVAEFTHRKHSMFLNYLWSFISDSAKETRGYRPTVTLLLVSLYLIVGAAYGQFERFGVTGFARADVIKSKIEDATQPLETKINQQTLLLNEISKQLTDQLAAGTASEIRLNLSKLCSEPNRDERERLNKEIDRLQSQYFNYKLMRYEPPPCSQL